MTSQRTPFEQFEADAQRVVGKSIGECNRGDLEAIRQMLVAELTAEEAAVERADMALRETEKCRCGSVIAGGDIGTARPVHVCEESA